MPLTVPQIVYDPGTGPVTLEFTYPRVNKPSDLLERQAYREDSVTITGLVQSITQRVEKYFTLDMPNVPYDDLDDWASFIDYAILGGQFDYYPDAEDPSTKITYTLVDGGDASGGSVGWKPARAFFGHVSFTLYFRQVMG